TALPLNVAPLIPLTPFPLRPEYSREIVGWLPTENRAGLLGIGHQSRRITWTRDVLPDAYFLAGDLPGGFDNFQHRIAVPGSEIDKIRFASPAQVFECQNMRIRQISHVNVIANTSSVRCRIVLAKYGNFRLGSCRGRQHVGHEVRFRI